MNTRSWFAGPTLLLGLLVCSKPPSEIRSAPEAEFFAATPLPEETQHRGLVSSEEMFQGPLDREFWPHSCAVGAPSCLSMDDRPFQVCLLSEDCAGLMRESMRRGEHFAVPFNLRLEPR